MPSGDDDKQPPCELKTSEGVSEKANFGTEALTADAINSPIARAAQGGASVDAPEEKPAQDGVSVAAPEDKATELGVSADTLKAQPDFGARAASGQEHLKQPQNQTLDALISGFVGAAPVGTGEVRTYPPVDYAIDPAFDLRFARPGSPGLVKRSLCKFWQEGTCRNGTNCTWAHGEHELGAPAPLEGTKPRGVKRTFGGLEEVERALSEVNNLARRQICKFWLEGRCRNGDRCDWAHGDNGVSALVPMLQQQLHQLQQQLQQSQQPQLPQFQQRMLPQQQQQQQMLPLRPRVNEALLPRPLWRGSVDAGTAPEAQMPGPLWQGTTTTDLGPPLEFQATPLPLWNGNSGLDTSTPPPPEDGYLLAVAEQQLQEGISSLFNSSSVGTGPAAPVTLPAAAEDADYLMPPAFIEAPIGGPALVNGGVDVKQVVCVFWQQGLCERGKDCMFAHGEDEIGTPMMSRPPMPDITQQGPQPFTMMPGSEAMSASAGSSTGPFAAEPATPTDSLALGCQLQQQQATSRKEPCRFWLRGLCERGVNCLWPHENAEPLAPPSLPPPSLPPVWARTQITHPPSLPPREHPLVFSSIRSVEPTVRRTICKFWQEGKCSRGVGCTFAHGEQEIGTVADTSRRLAPPMAAAQPVQPALPLFDASC